MVTPATMISTATGASIDAVPKRFVSRGGDKLDGALDVFDVVITGRRWLDAGASSGGFTDRLLQGGALAVLAVDVGYGQLDWRLRNDDRVIVMERTNVRELQPEDLPFAAEGVVADLSFISLRLVLPAMCRVAAEDADFILMVKPQFEVGKERVGKGGVISDPRLWKSSITAVVDAAESLGLKLLGTTASRLPGPAGNREFFVHLRRGAGASDRASIDRAVEEVAR